jgi:hypothetical protein
MKYKEVQRVYSDPFPKKQCYGSHWIDLVMIHPPGIQSGGFVVSPDSVWYARVLLLYSAIVSTDTGSKIVPLYRRWKPATIRQLVIILNSFIMVITQLVLQYSDYKKYFDYLTCSFLLNHIGWLADILQV